MSSLNINIQSPNGVHGSLSSRGTLNKAIAMLIGIAAGAKRGTIRLSQDQGVQSAVPAVFSVTINYANLIAGETLDLGAVLTCTTSAPANENQFRKVTSASVTGDNLAAAINAHSLLGKLFTASNNAGVVTVTAKSVGSIPLPASTKDSSSGLAVASVTRGSGGSVGDQVIFGR